MSALRIAVVGASGFIGRTVARRLAPGSEVLPVRAPRIEDARDIADSAGLFAQYEQVWRRFAAELNGIDVVVNAAGVAEPMAKRVDPRMRGANSVLPLLVAAAAGEAGAVRFVHISSAAVQGRSAVLNARAEYAPLTAYARTKRDGELHLIEARRRKLLPNHLELRIFRATSVQGVERARSAQLARLARTGFAWVGAPGDQPSPVSLDSDLADAVMRCASDPGGDEIRIQPWNGMTVSDVVRHFGQREPRMLSPHLVRGVLAVAWASARMSPRMAHRARLIETLLVGQRIDEANQSFPRGRDDE